MSARPTPSTDRQLSLDLLRAIAIAMMVVVHFVENLSGSHGIDGGPMIGANRVWWLPTGFAAPIFTFLSGVNYRLWAARQAHGGRDDEAISKTTIRRGLFLFGLGFAFNILVWMPADTFNWDILTFTGSGLLALDVVRRMPPGVALAACGLVLLASPLLRERADYNAYWTEGYFDPDLTLSDVMLGYLVTGFFPLLPWIVYPVVGYVAAGELFPTEIRGKPADHGRRAGLAGLLLVVASLAILTVEPLLPIRLGRNGSFFWTMFPASTPYVLGTLGTALAATALLRWAVDRKQQPAWAQAVAPWASLFSRYSLSLYLLHHVVHVWPLWWAGLATGGGDTMVYWQRAMPAWQSFGLALIFLAVAAVTFRSIHARRIPTVESLMRWLCD
jgi:uncharacterized membrane protein